MSNSSDGNFISEKKKSNLKNFIQKEDVDFILPYYTIKGILFRKTSGIIASQDLSSSNEFYWLNMMF